MGRPLDTGAPLDGHDVEADPYGDELMSPPRSRYRCRVPDAWLAEDFDDEEPAEHPAARRLRAQR